MSEKYRNGSMMQTMTDYMDDTANAGAGLVQDKRQISMSDDD